jgi:hypothetical protein
MPKKRSTMPAVSPVLVRFICGDEDYADGFPPGELPEDYVEFRFFADDQERRALFAAALPEVQRHCRELGIDVPAFEDVP